MFQCVLLDSPALGGRTPDQAAFASHFRQQPERSVLAFPNLGGDAVMVVPRPADDPESHVHLAEFLRRAPMPQRRDLWRCVAEAMRQQLDDAPLWLSTAGGGVAWLHVRLDRRPKYYHHMPYRAFERPQP